MNSIIHSKFWLVLLFIPFISCHDEVLPPVMQGDMWSCHRNTLWDSIKTYNALFGEWDWEYLNCCCSNTEGIYVNEDLVIEFRDDGTLEVREDGQTTQSSVWQVVDGDGERFKLDVEPRVFQLYGNILFCDDRVEFNNSGLDGCDNFFRKRK